MRGFEAASLASKDWVADLYRRWKDDPSSVDERWAIFFAGFDLAVDGNGDGMPQAFGNGGAAAQAIVDTGDVRVLGVYGLVEAYRERGHLMAHLNPLEPAPEGHPDLDYDEFGFSEADLDRIVDPAPFKGLGRVPLRELIACLRATYCRTFAVECAHIEKREQRHWLQDRMEPGCNSPGLAPEARRQVLQQLVAAEGLETFLQVRYPTAKRFSLEGADALVPMLHALIDGAADEHGVDEIVFGMPHRGRLNVLANVLRKPYEMLVAEFEGALLAREATGDGDVKYHLGYSRDHTTAAGKKVHLSLSPNPSHLEAVDPVIEGMVRAKQNRKGDLERARVLPVLMHGDAAFTGQGVVEETLFLSELTGYRSGGTIHVIVNNQIGFTTPPEYYRFAGQPSDLGKVIQAPIFHVNGDDPEAAVHAARLAVAFRQAFKKDVFINLVCYRRHGHNELDDPTFTQPVMYKKIAAHPTPLAIYRKRLEADGVVTPEDVDRRVDEFRELMGDAQSYARDFMPRQAVFAFGGLWQGLTWAGDDWSADTRVSAEVLHEVAAAFTRVPPGFNPPPKVMKLLEQRQAMLGPDGKIDWACAEALALGSLAVEGIATRMSGQDSGRGTFSHRHAVLHDVETGATFTPLNAIRPGQGHVLVLDSMLSENAVLGFEFGFSLADPHKLVVWEAQFGDFANGAQVIIDQFIASSESKWQRCSGIVLLLPHGYEGQGPEHSSARLERFLQLCADDNMQVANLTTPAQYFHALRRQMKRSFRKPLVVMSPKALLRHKAAVSTLADLTGGTFQSVIDDPARGGAPEAGTALDPARVTRVCLCSGKVYYTVLHERRERQLDNVALVRVEQLHPFPHQELKAVLAGYPNAQQIYWVQEEPQNMGGWTFVEPRLRRLTPDGASPTYIGRDAAASPATGSYKVHQAEEAEFVARAFAR
jgi:2-oxoglutarate dehydrogenase E1 component